MEPRITSESRAFMRTTMKSEASIMTGARTKMRRPMATINAER
jgi:hypothetical protein